MKAKYLSKKSEWILGENIPNIDLFFCQIWLSCFTNQFKYPGGRAYKKIISVHQGYHQWFYYDKKDSYNVGQHLVRKFVKNPKFTQKANKMIVKWSDQLREFAENIPLDKLDKLSNNELWQIYKKHDDIHTSYYQWGWLPVAVDMFHNNLTKRLKGYLREKNIDEDKINEYLVLLTHPTKKSLIQKEQEELKRIALAVLKNKKQTNLFRNIFKNFKEKEAAKFGLATHTIEYEKALEEKVAGLKDKIDKNIIRKLQKHYLKYFYTKHIWTEKEGVYSFDHYLKELVRLVGSGLDVKKELKKEERENNKILKKRRNLIKKLNIKNPWRIIFKSWGDFMVTKIYRRYAQLFALYQMEQVLREIGRRKDLKLKEVRFLLPEEVKKILKGGSVNKKEVKQRTKFCVYYSEKNFDKIYTGQRAKKIVNKIKPQKVKDQEEIKGQTGCVGRAQGVVKIVIRPKDMSKMKKGDILVSIATDPDIVPAMKKAAAIITEQAG